MHKVIKLWRAPVLGCFYWFALRDDKRICWHIQGGAVDTQEEALAGFRQPTTSYLRISEENYALKPWLDVASECVGGLHFLVWAADDNNSETGPDKHRCVCPPSNFAFNGIGCQCGGR